ncbi:MAG: type V CRISPR-associated protein Cas12a/Cpf1 [Candidatus Fimenecus sp.]
MKKIDDFTRKYKLSKTLRFKLIPIGKTEENFNLNNLLQIDEERSKSYAKVKSIMDEYHREHIEKTLSGIKELNITEYATIYSKSKLDESDKKILKVYEKELRKEIKNYFNTQDTEDTCKINMVNKLLPEYLEKNNRREELECVKEFKNFTTYFSNFYKVREGIYKNDGKSNEICYRCINDNLPKFLDNIKIFEKYNLKDRLEDDIKEINSNFSEIYCVKIEELFSDEYFVKILSQTGIDRYNSFIGGYSNSDGLKIKGLNEYINLYNQQIAKTDKSKRIPKLKLLFKQILSDRETLSFVPETFDSYEAVVEAIDTFFEKTEEKLSFIDIIKKIEELFVGINEDEFDKIFVSNKNDDMSTFSNIAFGRWNYISDSWFDDYDEKHKNKSKQKNYDENKEKALKKIKALSLDDIEKITGKKENGLHLISTLQEKFEKNINDIENYYIKYQQESKNNSKCLSKNNELDLAIKNVLDSVKKLEHFLKLFDCSELGMEKEGTFYGKFLPLYYRVCEIDKLYNKVRNYLTKKHFSTDKIKVNFNNYQLLNGWSESKEKNCLSILLKKDDNYYLAVFDKKQISGKEYNKFIEKALDVEKDDINYKKMVYNYIPTPVKMLPKVFFPKKNKSQFSISKEIEKIKEEKSFKNNQKDLVKIIDFYREQISNYEDWKIFNFKFKATENYDNINEFYKDFVNQSYRISFVDVSKKVIDSYVENGKLYLFQLYNKDFSKYSKGKPNLHTMYFKMLFDKENLDDVVFKLNGNGEIFYRKKSIKEEDIIKHPKNLPIKNKNMHTIKEESIFDYDLIKDKRYTKNQFTLHVPITLNYKEPSRFEINNELRKAIKESENNNIIGIDRGERNLIYVCVINEKGEIQYQKSLNEITNEYKSEKYITDYHELLNKKEKEIQKAQRDWKTIENIKELKEGYISQVVHKICELVKEYDAIIVMENLNQGFKNSRAKVKKSVYQKFEKMLIDKLNFLADKSIEPSEAGGLLNAYQLTNSFKSFEKMRMQNGFIFYIPAWLTSKIDPTTGFVNLFDTRFKNIVASQEFFKLFDDIRYNKKENYFEFEFDYSKFPKGSTSYKKKWTVCSNGERIESFRDDTLNNKFNTRRVILTDEFLKLFKEYDILLDENLKEQIANKNSKRFFKDFLRLFRLLLQMRNSEISSDVDYIISPVKNDDGVFYYSEAYKDSDNSILPKDADANGAYNIARKGLWVIEQIKKCENDNDLANIKLEIPNKEWLEFAQRK